jgi:GT2 family glycosyltransferase/glycosyltransferase involved in cell wall biosynthesis
VVPPSIVHHNVDTLLNEGWQRAEEVGRRLAPLREAGAKAESRAAAAERKTTRLEGRATRSKAAADKAARELDASQAEVARLEQVEVELGSARERAASAELEMRQARRRTATAEDELRRARKRDEGVRSELEEARRQAESSAERFRAARARAAGAETEAGELRAGREAAWASAMNLEAQASRAVAEAMALRSEADELRAQIRFLRARAAREARQIRELQAQTHELSIRTEEEAARVGGLRDQLAEQANLLAAAEQRNGELTAVVSERDAAAIGLAKQSTERDAAAIRLIEAEREQARDAVERGLDSHSWRIGHSIVRLLRLAGLRRTSRSSSFDTALGALRGPSLAARRLGAGSEGSKGQMRIGFIEPHLGAVGGIRRVLEVSNRLVSQDHEVTIYLPADQPLTCDWMECRARLRHIEEGTGDELDFIVFNHEPQWYLLQRFERARYGVFLALSYSRAYEKDGSWESLRVPVDIRLANSAWTADCIAAEVGARPSVVPTGVDQELFKPVATAKRYPVLCIGDRRPWKGSEVIERACDLLGLKAEKLAGRGLSQADLAAEYSKAEVFAVGSPIDGFGFPGLEALACGVPLVTTDNGGCREYAIHEETALIVPPGDPEAMAAAISRLRASPELRRRLIDNGLRLVREQFSWDRAADGFESELRQLLDREPDPVSGRGGPLRLPEPQPIVTIVVLSYNTLELLMRCVESIRQHTDVPYELIVVDNASSDGSAEYVAAAADHAIVNKRNAGFSGGFNQGLAAARGSHILFLNSDTKLPPGWASRLIETIERHQAGIVFPAVTAAGNPATVRKAANDRVVAIPPYLEPPSGVALLMRTDVSRALGGWNEDYEIASGEDTDLCFTVWVNGLSMVLDEAVLVDHVAKASAKQLPDQIARWARNRERFLERWTGPLQDVPRLDSIGEAEFADNKQVARGVAFWMYRYFGQREENLQPKDAAAIGLLGGDPPPPPLQESLANGQTSIGTRGTETNGHRKKQPLLVPVRATWRLLRPLVPEATRERYYRRHRDRYERVFPERTGVDRQTEDDIADGQP